MIRKREIHLNLLKEMIKVKRLRNIHRNQKRKRLKERKRGKVNLENQDLNQLKNNH